MKFVSKLVILALVLVNGMTSTSADVIVDGQVIEAADISSIMLDPISGNLNIAAGGLYTVTKDGEPPPGPQVVINSLTTSSNTITAGQSVTISWTTTNATACTPTGGTGGWSGKTIALPAGNSGSMTLSTQGTYVFTLGCVNATPTSATRNVTVVVNPDIPPPPDDCPTPTLSGFQTTWDSHFGVSWPNPNYAEVLTGITRGGYLAIEFNTGNILEDGGVTTITHTSTNGNRLGAISRCPGDFSAELPDTLNRCTEDWFIGGSITWNTLAGSQPGQCNLEPNTTYYLNLTFTNGVSSSTDRCASNTTCRTITRVWK